MTVNAQRQTTVSGLLKIGVPVATGSAVAVALGVYGGLHDPAGFSINIGGFSGTQSVKTWLTTVAFLLALVQLGSALAMYGKVRGVIGPPWIGTLHRWSGRAAVLVVVPVVVHCLYALGLQSTTTRVLVHSLLGCFFFGAFTAKMLLLTRRGLPAGCFRWRAGWCSPRSSGCG